ncbi:MAG TPA: ATP-dependent DNA ligase [Candidatus Limnocylindria bacterium]|jgi:DNA ligase-1|nr:ATP-dependent DNA ligase [Candidatus Limnocylindria bacterium]
MRSSLFAAFAKTAEAVAATTSKLRKRDLLASYLRNLPPGDVPIAATFFAGRPLPGSADKLGLGWVQQTQALAAATGADDQALHEAYLRHSDFGDAAADLLDGREPSGAHLRLTDVDAAFRAMSAAGSTAARVGLMTDLFRRATAPEARFVGRIAARELRIGLREGLLEDAIAAAFARPIEAVRRALMLVGEPGEAAILARDDRLADAALHLGRPVRFMLATPVVDADEVMRRVGDEAWIEDKYDGIRAQLHLDGNAGPRLFSRDLNEIGGAFPEVVSAAAAFTHRLVIDGELVPYRAGAVLDFASLQTRLGRVDPSPELLEQVPVVLVAFDLLHLDGRDMLETPLRERRAALEGLALPERSGERFLYSHLATARSADEVETHFDDARERRNEGLMVKDPESVYQPGRRGLGWLKLKKALATLDCVVVGVEWGHGKRRGVLSDYTFAVRAADGDSLLTIGKAYTGLTDAEIATMTEHFKEITLRDFGRYRTVVPEVVVEIAFDRIMRSARHKSGFAMRFPRIVRIRDDKTPADIDELATVEKLFAAQASGRILLARGARGETERIAATGEVGDEAVEG